MLSVRQPAITLSCRTLLSPCWIWMTQDVYQAREKLVFWRWCSHHNLIYLCLVWWKPKVQIFTQSLWFESNLRMVISRVGPHNADPKLV